MMRYSLHCMSGKSRCMFTWVKHNSDWSWYIFDYVSNTLDSVRHNVVSCGRHFTLKGDTYADHRAEFLCSYDRAV